MRPFRSVPVLAGVLFASGCAVGPDYAPPPSPSLGAFVQPAEGGLVAGPLPEAPWWRTLGDPQLAALVDRALVQNHDVRSAVLALAAARAQAGMAAGDQWPGLDARANYEHRRESENTPFGAFIPRTDIHQIGLDAGWELDLWGRVRRGLEAAAADHAAAEHDARGAALMVAADVATAWMELRAAKRRLQIGTQNLELQQQTLALVQARSAAGLVVERDVAQAATVVESTRARLPLLEVAAATAGNRLAVLLGVAPAELPAEVRAGGPLPAVPAAVAVGVPADLVRRRPDVLAAERRFAAAVARIGVAEADFYPRLSLAGTLGIASDGPEDLFASGSGVLGFGPSVRWNLFDAGRLRNRLESLEANAERAQVAWEQAVLRAVEETENAMTGFVREQVRRGALERAATEARRAVQLAEAQYKAGLSDFQAVIDSQRTVATIEDDLVQSEAAVGLRLVALFQALGGGLAPAAVSTSGAPGAAAPAGG